MTRYPPEFRTFLRGEFIGMKMEIGNSPNHDLMNLTGMIVDETKHTFMVRADTGKKTIPKSKNTFIINGREVIGKDIMFRPEDRIKKIR